MNTKIRNTDGGWRNKIRSVADIPAVDPPPGNKKPKLCGQKWDYMYQLYAWEQTYCQGKCVNYVWPFCPPYCCPPYCFYENYCSLDYCCGGDLPFEKAYTFQSDGGIAWCTFINNSVEKNNVVVVNDPTEKNCNSPEDWSWPDGTEIDGNTPPSPAECSAMISDCSKDYGEIDGVGVRVIYGYKWECLN